VDFEQGILRINKGKGGKDRIVPIGEKALGYVKEYLEKVRGYLTRKDSGDILFLSLRGKKIDQSELRKKIKGFAKIAGLKKNVTTRSFRVALATEMLRRDADIRQIQEILGHRKISTTEVYLRVVKDELKRVHTKTHPRER
jgi:integrase/recombinase XerD